LATARYFTGWRENWSAKTSVQILRHANQNGPDVIQRCRKKITKMNILRYRSTIAILALFAGLTACTQQQQSPQEVREKTAQATAEAKSDVKAVAEGIREGWNRNKPLDINSASRDQLTSLPGVSGGEADRVIAGRPYDSAGDLVTRHIVSKAEYDKIADQVTAKKR
jgi:DNA uptake protein ComE-like DNA-binding protein